MEISLTAAYRPSRASGKPEYAALPDSRRPPTVIPA